MTSPADGPASTPPRELAEILARAEELGIDPRRVITALAVPADVVGRLLGQPVSSAATRAKP
jgi:hypothetical protein